MHPLFSIIVVIVAAVVWVLLLSKIISTIKINQKIKKKRKKNLDPDAARKRSARLSGLKSHCDLPVTGVLHH
jgi:biopolymer transport protein ExbB/TolQ